MPLYYRTEQIAAAGGGAFALSIAVNRSSCSQAELFHQQVISLSDRTMWSLGALGAEQGATALAGAADAPVAAVAGAARGGVQRVRVLDVARRGVVADLTAPEPFHRIAIDATGTHIGYVLTDRVAITEVIGGREVASFPFATGRRFGAYLAWVQGGWVVAHAREKKWSLVVLSDGRAPVRAELPLRGEPFNLAGAAGAPVVACGIGKKAVQVLDLASGASVVVSPHTANDAYAAVTVAVSADGTRVFSGGTEDGRLCVLPRGAKEAREVAPLPTSQRTERGVDLLTTPAFAVCAETLVTVVDGVPSFHALGDETAPAGDAWGPPPKAPGRAKR